MEFKGTKGKWYLQEFTDAYTNIIRVKTETSDAIYLGSSSQNPNPEYRYNALLISKAPEMLEMLKELKDRLEYYNDTVSVNEIEQLIKEATELC
jgi:threonine synthase